METKHALLKSHSGLVTALRRQVGSLSVANQARVKQAALVAASLLEHPSNVIIMSAVERAALPLLPLVPGTAAAMLSLCTASPHPMARTQVEIFVQVVLS